MKELREFLAEATIRQPKKGMVGLETDWKQLAELTLKGGKFLICDFQFVPSEEDGVSIQAAPGKYNVEAKAIDFDGDRRISRLRVYRHDARPVLGKTIGETWTDTAYSAVCDFDYFSKEWDSLGEDAAGDKLQEEYGAENCGVFRLSPNGSEVPFVSSGFGDGTFSIFELCDGEKRVGFEIEFIAASEGYPFEPATTAAPLSEEQKAGIERQNEVWNKMGEMLQAVQKQKTGDKQADRRKLEEAFSSFMKGLEDKVIVEIEPLRKHFQQVRRKSLPLTTEYRPMLDTSWLSLEQVASRIAALRDAGFKQIGCFQPTTAPSAWRVVFLHPKGECEASVIKLNSDVSLHIGYRFRDETEDEFTDNTSGATKFLPPWLRYVSRPDLTAHELILFAARERRPAALDLAIEKNYAKEASKSWSRLIAWRAETGGLPLAYFEEKLQNAGGIEDVEKAQMMRRDEADKSLCNWLRLQPSLPFNVNEVLDSLVIVHDELSPSDLAAAWWCGTNDVKVREAEFSGEQPRRVFAEINRRRENKLRLVLEKCSGFPADFYLPVER